MVDVIVVGSGYIGLTLSVFLAKKGRSVLAIDIDVEKIDSLKGGVSSIFEEGLNVELKRAITSKNLEFSSNFHHETSARHIFVATSYTPEQPEQYLKVFEDVRHLSCRNPIFMIRGTVPIGFIRDQILPKLESLYGVLDRDFFLVSAPERTLSGDALEELQSLPQILGGSKASLDVAKILFEDVGIGSRSLESYEEAEIVKAYTNFSRLCVFNLSNYLGVLCQYFELNQSAVVDAMTTKYERLSFLCQPGPGVGGFCLPKDSLVLNDAIGTASLDDQLRTLPLNQYALNQSIMNFYNQKLCASLEPGSTILAMGLAFKGTPKTDDVRGSVGVATIRALQDKGYVVECFDITVKEKEIRNLGFDVANLSFGLEKYKAILLMNNDKDYLLHLAEFANETASNKTVHIYDPWNLLGSFEGTAFYYSVPLTILAR